MGLDESDNAHIVNKMLIFKNKIQIINFDYTLYISAIYLYYKQNVLRIFSAQIAIFISL